jgi:hypothetical protein
VPPFTVVGGVPAAILRTLEFERGEARLSPPARRE